MGDVEHGKNLIYELSHQVQDLRNIFDFAVKFQYRNLNTYIHPDYKGNKEVKFVKRFEETALTPLQFKELLNYAREVKFKTVCTPFDQYSVDLLEEHQYDFLKIASCALTDWPLLERVSKTQLPIIASTAGSTFDDIDKVVTFLNNRNKNLTLMHCVAKYPTANADLELSQIDVLKNKYNGIPIGYSTHESPNNFLAVAISIAKGVRIFEKHVGLKTGKHSVNAYSASPEEVRTWLLSAKAAFEMCGIESSRYVISKNEISELCSLRRACFVTRDIKPGEYVYESDILLAIPSVDGQMLANDLSKYTEIRAQKPLKKGARLMHSDVTLNNKRERITKILDGVKSMLKRANVVVNQRLEMEISHHYGLEKFHEFGATIINFINREYCKKIIIILSGQTHPEQFHKMKEETFHVLYGEVNMVLNGVSSKFCAGDIVTIEKGVKHQFSSLKGAVIEEISSTHYKDDSYYTDETISNHKNRKTILTYWM